MSVRRMESGVVRLRALGIGTVLGTLCLIVRCRIGRVSMAGVVSSTWMLPKLDTRGTVQLGARCSFRNSRTRSEVGAQPGGVLEVGDRTFINEGATVVATRHIQIGRDCRIGEFVGIFDTDYHSVEAGEPVRSGPVHVGENVWIARGALVLPGVRIGDNSVVGAHSVVTADVPSNSLVVGNPARVVRTWPDMGVWRRE